MLIWVLGFRLELNRGPADNHFFLKCCAATNWAQVMDESLTIRHDHLPLQLYPCPCLLSTLKMRCWAQMTVNNLCCSVLRCVAVQNPNSGAGYPLLQTAHCVVKLGKKRWKSSKLNYYIVSPRLIIQAIIVKHCVTARNPKCECRTVLHRRIQIACIAMHCGAAQNPSCVCSMVFQAQKSRCLLHCTRPQRRIQKQSGSTHYCTPSLHLSLSFSQSLYVSRKQAALKIWRHVHLKSGRFFLFTKISNHHHKSNYSSIPGHRNWQI